jgi:hypothetical protein
MSCSSCGRVAPPGNGKLMIGSASSSEGCRYLLRERVRAAFLAAADRAVWPRRRAAACACREIAFREADACPSRFSAPRVARARLGEVDLRPPVCAFLYSRFACRRVSSETEPFSGGGSSTPARRAFERPIATACLADRAPCLPCLMWRNSSRTNSPACVEDDLPSLLSS